MQPLSNVASAASGALSLDYTPLQSKVDYQSRLRQKHGWLMPILAGIAGLLLAAPILTAIVMVDLRYMLSPVSIYGLFAVAAVVSMYVRAGQVVRMQRFADANDLTYRRNTTYDGREGVIFRRGHSKTFTDLFSADGLGVAEIGNYQFETGSGRNRTTHRRGFVRIKLDRHLPHMILDAKSNNFLGSNLDHGLTNEQRLSLEGDFDKYFQLYAPPEYKRDALYIFTPDVMASMIDTASDYDCEIIDNSLYLYSSGKIKLTNIEQMRQLFTIAEKVRGRINKQATNYADENVGDRSRDMVAYSGARLRKKTNLYAKIAFGITALFFIGMMLLFIL